jgi:hypothetical protein
MSLALVILAAGRASRFGRLKQLEPVGPHGAALMDYGIHEAARAGVERVVLIVPPGEEARFEDHVRGHCGTALDLICIPQSLEPLPSGFTVPSDRKKPWGTAHAVLASEAVVDGPFIVANADDHYGVESYALLVDWLRGVAADAARFAVVGYRLDETLSAFGGVSRAVCRANADGMLADIQEILDIARGPDGTLHGTPVVGDPVMLEGDEQVSQNLWGFTLAAFPLLSKQFSAFLRQSGDSPATEFLIPTAATEQIRAGSAAYQLLPTAAYWFGFTFPEDADAVRRRIAELHARGDYPDHLGEGMD